MPHTSCGGESEPGQQHNCQQDATAVGKARGCYPPGDADRDRQVKIRRNFKAVIAAAGLCLTFRAIVFRNQNLTVIVVSGTTSCVTKSSCVSTSPVHRAKNEVATRGIEKPYLLERGYPSWTIEENGNRRSFGLFGQYH